jgi:hypothetical protein
LNDGCLWVEDINVNYGICMSSSSSSSSSSSPLEENEPVHLKCEMLLKHQCNLYVNVNDSYMNSKIIIDDGPCFFNGIDDNSKGDCIEKRMIIENSDCTSIKTNDIIVYEGEERESCNSGHIIFGYAFTCGWIKKHDEDKGSCGDIYFLTEKSFLPYILFFFFFMYIHYFFFCVCV